jgi:hypothetical protein
VTSAAETSDSVGTIAVVAVLVFFAGSAWIGTRISNATSAQRNAPSIGGPAWLSAFFLWGLTCIGGAMVAIIVVTGSPFGGGSSSSPDHEKKQLSASPQLVDLAPPSPLSDYETGSAEVGGRRVRHALLIGAGSGSTQVDLPLDGRYGVLRATVGMAVTSSAITEPRSMRIRFLLGKGSSPVFDMPVGSGDAPIHRRIALRHARTLRIVVTDNGESVYDEAVIAGVVH